MVKNFLRRLYAQQMVKYLKHHSKPYSFPSGNSLVLAPHADDETLGCGGLIAAKRHRNQNVQVVFLTDSSGSHPGHPVLTPEKLALQRKEEAFSALNILGVDKSAIHFIGLADGNLNQLTSQQSNYALENIATLLKTHNINEIFIPYRNGGSSEHSAAHDLAVIAARQMSFTHVYEYPIWAWWNASRLRPRLNGELENHFLELGQFKEAKLRAISCYKSQNRPTEPWKEPVMPPVLLKLCTGPLEFFFTCPI